MSFPKEDAVNESNEEEEKEEKEDNRTVCITEKKN